MEKLQSKLEPSLDKTDQLLKESQEMYKDLKEQCDNLDIVLAEYGYHYDESTDEQENHLRYIFAYILYIIYYNLNKF